MTMRLDLTRRTDLATLGLLELARSGGRTKAADLAERIGTTKGFLSHAMTPLVARGWVRSDPGPSGGYALVADPHQVSVLDVIEAVEGPTDASRCVLQDRACAAAGPCALHGPWSAARARLLDELAGTPLATLLDTTPERGTPAQVTPTRTNRRRT
jgi:Rrf2 family transcriptional regulator, iron-sulfur cluster assembly transcription factor